MGYECFEMKNTIKYLLLALLAFTLASCMKEDDVKVTSYKLESVSPNGLRSVDICVRLTIDNSVSKIKVLYLDGVIKRDGEPFANVEVPPFEIMGHAQKAYDIKGTASLVDGVSVLKLLSLTQNPNLEDFSIDFEIRARKGLFTKTFRQADIPASQLTGKIQRASK